MNKSRKLLSAIIVLMAFVPVFAAGVSYTQYVNPLIGTGGHGHVFLGANVPFGFVQLGPTQPTRGWDWCSGYHYSDSVLVGFSHQHLSGTGIGDLGDITMLPVKDATQNHVIFTHQAETAVPGYYSVKLNEPNVMVELTATQRVGMHRYTFGGNEHRGLFRLDLKRGVGWDNLVECKFTLEKPTMITGYRLSSGWAKRQQVFFAAEFSKPVTLVSTEGDSIAVIAVDDVSQPLLVKVALSPVSIANAKENLLAELPGWDFVQTYKKADEAWNDELAKILIETNDDEAKRVFYTALFHTMTAPSVFCDVNGEYYGSDGKTHHADFTNYTTLSLWDTYRAAHPLMTLIHPERQYDIASTFINIYRQQGKLPVWHLMGNETDCMVGNPGIPVLADLVIKGYVDDKEAAYEAMKASAMADERGLALLKEYGYLPYDKEPTNETVAKGLEYALADACVAKVAQLLGKQQDAKYFSQRSQLYRRLFDKERQFMRALDSKGQFRPLSEPFDPIRQHSDYTEGNAWQYIWLVPHDVKGLIGLFGGDKPFVEKLDSLFIVEGDLGENAAPDISGLIGQYAHGNEPSHHVIYLYNYAGMPWKGAPLLRKTMKEMYSDNPDGLSGNEDVGQMSAWYVLSSIGLYQVEPAGGVYVIGSPLFDNATIEVGGGRTFTVTTRNNSPENCYVQSVRLNDKPHAYSYITFADIMKGGVMEVTMGPQPSKWGTATGNRPPSLLDKGRKINMTWQGVSDSQRGNSRQQSKIENNNLQNKKVMELTDQQIALVAIAANEAKGNIEALKREINNGFEVGLTVSQMKEALSHLYAYTGFPRSLNALGALQQVINERKQQQLPVDEGQEAAPLPDDYNALARGTEVQTRLTGKPFTYEFAPQTDYYLKAHLFGDIFARNNLTFAERELVTIGAISMLKGCDAQLKAHLNGALNMGVTKQQLDDIPKVLAERAADDKACTPDGTWPVGSPNTAYAQYFIGNSYLAPMDADHSGLVNVTFEPRCRNNWHIHHKSVQVLICVSGRGWYVEEGKEPLEMTPGTVVAIPAEVRHWHGAAKDSWFQHLTYMTKVQEGASNEWLQPVTDEEYDLLK